MTKLRLTEQIKNSKNQEDYIILKKAKFEILNDNIYTINKKIFKENSRN